MILLFLRCFIFSKKTDIFSIMKTNVIGSWWIMILCVACGDERLPPSKDAPNLPKNLLKELEDKSKIALGGHPSTRDLSELLKDAVEGAEIYAWDIGEAALRLFHMDDGSLGVLTKGAERLRWGMQSLKIGKSERVKALDSREANLKFKEPLIIGNISTENYTYSVVTFPLPLGSEGELEFQIQTGRIINTEKWEWVTEKSYRLTVNVNHKGPKMVGTMKGLSDVSAAAD